MWPYVATHRAVAMAIPTLRSTLPAFNHNVARPAPKRVDPFYKTDQYAAWRDAVKERARYRCEYVHQGTGKRCNRKEHRMFADHVVEVKDGGAAYDPDNGQCLCGRHHTLKTIAARRLREGQPR